MLIEGDTVAAIGYQEQPPAADRTLDLPGHHVLPGFIDVHLHLTQAAWFPHGVDGSAWRGVADALRAIRVAADSEPADLTVCDGDPFEPRSRVVQTWVAGQIAWRRQSLAARPR